MSDCLTLAPSDRPNVFRAADGGLHTPPPGWACLAPGDAGLTRRVKAAGPSWVVIEKRGRKSFSQGLWAPAAHIEAARAALAAERATPAYAKKRDADAHRREREQIAYVADFCQEVLAFLAFAPDHQRLAESVAAQVTAHATPVGSGTVARTRRIDVDRRAEAAVIAWMRHQTTGYDDMKIARIKGRRREVRRVLASASRTILDQHRGRGAHPTKSHCPLCRALSPAG